MAATRHGGHVTTSLDDLLERQHGLVSRRQLAAHGLDPDRVRNQVRAGRWALATPRVVATSTGHLSVDQRRWAAVLHAGPGAMLGGLTAASCLGLRSWDREMVTVWVDDRRPPPVPGVEFVRTRRPCGQLRHPSSLVPRARLEPAVLLWAAYDAPSRAAVGVLAATVQQRCTTVPRLVAWVERLQPLRRASLFRSVLADVAGGSHSAAERDVVRLCRRYGIAEPHRQRRRPDRDGTVRWSDCEWDLPDGTVVLLEVDGALHLEAATWTADKRRARRLAGPGRIQLACTETELRTEPHEVARDLIALGVPGRGSSDALRRVR